MPIIYNKQLYITWKSLYVKKLKKKMNGIYSIIRIVNEMI